MGKRILFEDTSELEEDVGVVGEEIFNDLLAHGRCRLGVTEERDAEEGGRLKTVESATRDAYQKRLKNIVLKKHFGGEERKQHEGGGVVLFLAGFEAFQKKREKTVEKGFVDLRAHNQF